MPIETVPNTSLTYYLISFDEKGNERDEPDGKKLSEQIFSALANEPITDVFIMSHGWMGDVPAAIKQYNEWIGAMAGQTADIDKIKKRQPGFRPLMIGVQWPSKPAGNYDLTTDLVSFGVNDEDPVDRLVDEYASCIADTEPARQALQTIIRAAMEDGEPPETLPPEVLEAYQVLNQEANLGTEGVGGAPGSDWEGFDPEAFYEADPEAFYEATAEEPVSFGLGSWVQDRARDAWGYTKRKIMEGLPVMSFWEMKARARTIGESGGFNFLKTLQEKAANTVRFHLMGHSFGCIMVSSMLNGPQGEGTLLRPVDSLVLIQGAVSLWCYCSKILYEKDHRPGYFNKIIAQGKVAGPIVVTYSQFDYAVRRMYPNAGKVAFSSLDFAPGELPKYGGIGTYGLAGDDLAAENIYMLDRAASYDFKPGKIYNLDSSQFICNVDMGPLVGAHSDIAKPEVAHAVWSAAYAS